MALTEILSLVVLGTVHYFLLFSIIWLATAQLIGPLPHTLLEMYSDIFGHLGFLLCVAVLWLLLVQLLPDRDRTEQQNPETDLSRVHEKEVRHGETPVQTIYGECTRKSSVDHPKYGGFIPLDDSSSRYRRSRCTPSDPSHQFSAWELELVGRSSSSGGSFREANDGGDHNSTREIRAHDP